MKNSSFAGNELNFSFYSIHMEFVYVMLRLFRMYDCIYADNIDWDMFQFSKKM